MAGRFEGLSDLKWKLFEDIFPETPKKRALRMPPVPFRYVLNSLLYILITGCRWCDLPRGTIWASKSAAHRWLKRWREDGTNEHLQARILALADSQGLINWNYGAIDGSFSPGKGYRVHTSTQENKICGFRPPNPPILEDAMSEASSDISAVRRGKRVQSPPNLGDLGG